ncbi:MAG: LysR family transcriptional regulator [Paracoccaceae bacterium]
MNLESWDEIRTAWQVVKAGTVSGAAEVLGVHHATVIRHIDMLESRLGVKLFQRHARGYTPTEAGQTLAQVGRITEEQFAHLATRLAGVGAGITGDLVITTLPALAALIREPLAALSRAYPDLCIRVRTERRVLRLEYGEAHLALRAGARPTEPDNVVQSFMTLPVALYASPSYVEAYGLPATEAELADHRFALEEGENARAPFIRWLAEQSIAPRISFRSNEPEEVRAAIAGGMGLGFLYGPYVTADMIEVLPPRPEWAVNVWLVTHVDLHRTAKVQAALSALKTAFET